MSAEQAPSIGSKIITFDPQGLRVRQITEAPVHEASGLLGVLRGAHAFAQEHGATRAVVRSLVAAPEVHLPDGFTTEAAIPLSGGFEGLTLSYFGWNSPDRRSRVVTEQMALLSGVQQRPRKTAAEILAKTEARGYRLERLQGDVSEKDYAQLLAMYQSSFGSYPFSVGDQIRGMVSDPDTHVYAARSTEDDQLWAVAATEQVTLDTPNGPFTMREMGDSARMPGATGLNAPLKLALIGAAACTKTDLVFCESRAALGAVNAVNHDIGMGHYGLLPKHTVISGRADIDEVGIDGANGALSGQYGNLHVWALNGAQVEQIGAEVQAYAAR